MKSQDRTREIKLSIQGMGRSRKRERRTFRDYVVIEDNMRRV